MLFLRLLVRALRWRAAASLSVFVVAAVAILSAVLGPVYLAAAGQRVLTDRLAAIPATQRNIQVVRDADPLAHSEDLTAPVRDSLRTVASSPWFGPATVSQLVSVGFTAPTRVAYSSRLATVDGQCAHLHFVQGQCPSAANDMAVSQRSAQAAHWHVGDVVRTTTQKDDAPLIMRITAIYLPVDPGGPYWRSWHYFDKAPAIFDGQLPRLDSLLVAPATFATYSHRISVRTVGQVALAVSRVQIADEPALRAVISATVSDANALTHGDLNPMVAASELPANLDAIDNELSLTRTLVDLATLQLAVLAICVLYAIVATTAAAHGSEVALAKLRGRSAGGVIGQGIAEPVVLVLLAAPVGAVLAWLAVRALAPHVLAHAAVGFPRAALLVTLATAAAAVVAAALAARRIVVAPVSSLLRRGTEAGTSKTGLLVADAAALTLAVAGLAQLHFGGVLTKGKPDALSALAPTLLAVAVAIVGLRLVPYLARAALRATRDSPRLVLFLAVRQILRRANSTRLALLVSVALALATLAITTWSVGGTNRQIRAGNEAGADRVLTVQMPQHGDLRALVDAADPSGREAMAVELLPVSSTQLLAVDTTRLAAIAQWRPDFAGPSLASIARKLHPRLPEPLAVAGRTMSVTMRVALTAGVPLRMAATVLGEDHIPSSVALGPLVRGAHSYTAPLPVDCVRRCRLTGFTLATPESYNPPQDSRIPGFKPQLDALVTAVTSSAASAAENAAWSAALRDGNRWRQGGANGSLVAAIRNGLDLQVAPPPGTSLWPSLLTGDVPDHVPALIAATTASVYPGQQRHDISATGLDGNPLPVDGVAVSAVLPRIGQSGVLADIDTVERAMTGPEATGVLHQVWLSSSASPSVIDRLRRSGITIVSSDSLRAHRAVLDRTGPAYADTVFLLAALAATVLAIGGAVLAALVTARRRSYELAALEAVGVGPRTLRWASAVEQGLLIGLGVVFGVVSGIAGSALALPSTPIFINADTGPPIEYALPWRTLLVLVAALVVVLALLCLVMARAIERQAGAGRLREAGA